MTESNIGIQPLKELNKIAVCDDAIVKFGLLGNIVVFENIVVAGGVASVKYMFNGL